MRTVLIAALISCLSCQSTQPSIPNLTFFIGTYTQHEGHVDGKGDGIYKMTFDPTTLDMRLTDTIKGMINPSFLALSRDASKLFAVNEIGPGGKAIGRFESYAVDLSGFGNKLSSISTQGYAPCHIAINSNETIAVVCNYAAGVVSVFAMPLQENSQVQKIQSSRLPKNNPRQEDAHPHSAAFSADGQFVYLADLGTDRIMVYHVDETHQQLRPAERPFFELPDGSGPRHMSLSQDGKILYVLCELSNEILVLDISEKGDLQQRQMIRTLPADFQGKNSSADIHLSPDGKWLYSSNRGHHSIAVFSIAPDGSLSSVGHVGTQGKTPRNFHLTKDGHWMLVANQDSDNIALFDLKKGGLPVYVKSMQVNTPVAIVQAQ